MIIYAVVNGLLDDVCVEDIATLQDGLFAYVDTRFPEVTASIRDTGDLSDATAETLRGAVLEYKRAFTPIQ